MAPRPQKRKRSPSTTPPAKKNSLSSAETTATTLKQFAPNLKEDPNKLSLLLDLPPELRNKIYEYAIGGHVISVSGTGKEMRFERQGRLRGASSIEQTALHYACRQTHHETADMHFRLNTFCGGPWPLEQFLSHRKTPKDQITSI